jgi:hypothetical protein
MKKMPLLSAEDAIIIARKTGYTVSSVQALLRGRRRKNAMNKKVFEIAAQLRKIRREADRAAKVQIKEQLQAI